MPVRPAGQTQANGGYTLAAGMLIQVPPNWHGNEPHGLPKNC